MKQGSNKQTQILNRQAPPESQEDFHWGSALAVLALLLMFVGATFYVLFSSLLEIR